MEINIFKNILDLLLYIYFNLKRFIENCVGFSDFNNPQLKAQ